MLFARGGMGVVLGLWLASLACAACASYNAYRDVGNHFRLSANEEGLYSVPSGFLIGAGSSSYQTEGAWNEDGREESVLDSFFRSSADMDDGDVACDSYHRYREDVQLAKAMQLNFYRITISWSRVLPDGTTKNINQAGVAFYNNLINEIIKNGIVPAVTIYHLDFPLALQMKGGWTGDSSVQDHFVEYAKFLFKTFGDRVKWWTTINEPHLLCVILYETGMLSPAVAPDPGVGVYKCGHNMLLAHAKAYRAYREHFSHQGGQVGIVLDVTHFVPLDADSPADRQAAERATTFATAWLGDPLLLGDYPSMMRQAINGNGEARGRLPTFTDEEKKQLNYSLDFIGINHYIAATATPAAVDAGANPSRDRDMAVITDETQWKLLGSDCGMYAPWALRGALNWLKNRYSNFPTFVTENGYRSRASEGLNDYNRITYHSGYLRATLRAVNEDGCHVLGYTVWSLMDSFELFSGYRAKFGISHVNFDDSSLNRTLKDSGYFLREVMQRKRVRYFPLNGGPSAIAGAAGVWISCFSLILTFTSYYLGFEM